MGTKLTIFGERLERPRNFWQIWENNIVIKRQQIDLMMNAHQLSRCLESLKQQKNAAPHNMLVQSQFCNRDKNQLNEEMKGLCAQPVNKTQYTIGGSELCFWFPHVFLIFIIFFVIPKSLDAGPRLCTVYEKCGNWQRIHSESKQDGVKYVLSSSWWNRA